MNSKPLILTPLETLINQAFRLDSQSLQALSQLTGKIFQLTLTGVNFHITFLADEQGMVFINDYQGTVDAHITVAPFTGLHLLLQNSALINNPDVTIDGDSNSTQRLLEILQNLNLNWEEQLAHLFGDFPAQQFSNLVHKTTSYTHQRYQTLLLNLSEYLQEESHYLPTATEIKYLFNSINHLRDDLERLEQRLQRLL
jgi:ubiquinone biosynthesis protein UbiJ